MGKLMVEWRALQASIEEENNRVRKGYPELGVEGASSGCWGLECRSVGTMDETDIGLAYATREDPGDRGVAGFGAGLDLEGRSEIWRMSLKWVWAETPDLKLDTSLQLSPPWPPSFRRTTASPRAPTLHQP